jgi:hypothetical protein
MTSRAGEWGVAALAVLASMGIDRDASAAAHRVAAVDPDPQVARALDVALSPWDVALVELHLESPGASMPIALDRARLIAHEANADVVVWVSSTDDGFAVWIYDAASDHASARKIEQAPPFDGPTAAGVALSVKTLLRGTVIAPPPERFGAAIPERPWRLGLSFGASSRTTSTSPFEPRLGVEASGMARYWGGVVDVEFGPGWHPPESSALTGTVTDAAVRVGLAARLPLSTSVALEPSLGGALHWERLGGVVVADALPVSIDRLNVAFEPRIAVDVALAGGWLHLGPWFGASVLTRWQRFLVHDLVVLEIQPASVQAALCAAVTLP